MIKEIDKCRICGNTELVPVLDIGEHTISAVFPKTKDEKVICGPLRLVRCKGDKKNTCGLVQLKHIFDPMDVFGCNYGYRSKLNRPAVSHLYDIVSKIYETIDIKNRDIIVDLGSNDGTMLGAYKTNGNILVGIDPIGKRLKENYPTGSVIIPEYFSEKGFINHFGNKKAKVITSISMFSNINNPMETAQQIYNILADDGIWVLEDNSIMDMIFSNSYDNVCHEHTVYYSISQINWIANKIGFKIIDVTESKASGGCFLITLSKKNGNGMDLSKLLNYFERHLYSDKIYRDFECNVITQRKILVDLIVNKINDKGKIVIGYGASSRGNTILQYCNFTEKDIPFIVEINEEKIGSFMPQTLIPIISEKEVENINPDYFLILPWYFKDNIIEKEKKSGRGLIIPLPIVSVIGG